MWIPVGPDFLLHPFSDHLPLLMCPKISEISTNQQTKSSKCSNENIENFQVALKPLHLIKIAEKLNPNLAYN